MTSQQYSVEKEEAVLVQETVNSRQAGGDDQEFSFLEPPDDINLLQSQLSGTNYQKYDIQNVFSQHIQVSKQDVAKAGLIKTQAKIIHNNINKEENNGFDVDRTPSSAGVIEEIILQNFMCHDYFNLKLGPQLNFIIGRNGSGKSAILTSISVGLGCKAVETDRGRSLKNLIKRGTNSARITIIFSNKNPEFAYEFHKFGEKIIVERSLKIDGSNSYSIKNARGKTVSNKKIELDLILEFFDITINNPLAFLSQGAAKNFLSASTEQDKYAFFMKGIQMEQTLNEYYHSNNQLDKIHKQIDEKTKHITALRSDLENARMLYSRFHKFKDLRIAKKKVMGRLFWFKIASLKYDISILKNKKSNYNEKIKNSLVKIETDIRLKEDLKSKIDENNMKISRLNRDYSEMKSTNDNLHHLINDLDIKISRILDNINNLKLDNESKGRQINILSSKIKNEMKHISKLNEKESMKEDMLDDIQNLKSKQEHLAAEKSSLDKLKLELKDNLDQLEYSYKSNSKMDQRTLDNLTNELDDSKSNAKLLNRKIHMKKSNDRDNHSLFEEDSLDNFDQNIITLVNEINKNKHLFKETPIGPLGRYMKIKKMYVKFKPILESQLGPVIDAFLVSNANDQAILTQILNKINRNSTHNTNIQIVNRKLEKFNFRPVVEENNELVTIINTLEFSNEDAMFTVIDNNRIDSLVLSSDEHAANRCVHDYPKVFSCSCLFDRSSGKQFSYNSYNDTFKSDPIFYDRNHMSRLLVTKDKNNVNIEAEEEEERQSDIRELERLNESINEQVTKINDFKINVLKKKKNEFNAEYQSFKTRVSEIDTNLRQLLREQSAVNKKLNELEIDDQDDRDKDDSNLKLEEFKNNKNLLTEEIKINEHAIQDFQTEIDELNEKFISLKKEKIKHLENYEAFKDNINSLENDSTHIKNEIIKIDSKLSNHNTKVENFRNLIVSIDESLKKLNGLLVDQIPKAKIWCNEQEANIDLNNDTEDDLQKNLKMIEIQLNQANKSLGKSEDLIIKEYNEKNENYLQAKNELIKAHNVRDKLVKSIRNRLHTTQLTREILCLAANQDFSNSLHQRGFQGKLIFDYENSRLKMLVGKNGKSPRDVSSLSGGEKSFTQIALLLAIWKPMKSKIRGLDEFDVFMDTVNRRVSMQLMLESLRKEPKSQTIFITPQDIGNAKGLDGDDVTIHKLKDPARKNNSTNN